MTAAKALTVFFKDLDKHDLPIAGGKGANLGEMWQAGFPVPNGFAVTVESYERFLQESGLSDDIKDILKVTDVNNASELNVASRRIQHKIVTSDIPQDVAKEVVSAYKKLTGKHLLGKSGYVAVRSSATAEDLPNASFAGQQATFLNVKGDAELLHKVRECWASLFTARAIFYRTENKIPHEKVKISVIVQNMIQSVVSGVMFSVDPVSQAKDRIIIEAVWGLGEMIVQGAVVPDKYVVQKDTYFILSKEVSDQQVQLIRKATETIEREVPKKLRDKQKIDDKIVQKLAKLAQRSQDHYYFPQDLEWAWDGKDVWITQTRPITTLATPSKKAASAHDDITLASSPILTGSAASPGIGTGHVKIVHSARDIGKVLQGDVLVAEMTSPDFVPAMKKAAAIITNQGGQTSHAAIVSRELGVPCVVGTGEATSKLREGYAVTVDGSKGYVYLGSKVRIEGAEEKKDYTKEGKLSTATKLYVNLAEPERAREVAKEHVDGVGLLRAEFMIANIGIHPKEAIKQKKQEVFIRKLTKDLETFCAAFEPRPVTYRATDFKTNEYRQLPGGATWEPKEPNPLMGYRGAFRYVSSPEVFALELEAIRRVRENYKNLQLMIPYVRSPQELARVRRLVASTGLFESNTFKFWMMCELPVNVISLEDFIKVGIDGISVGSNDLSMLVLGTDRDNAEVASAFDERSPAVLWSLRRVARICNKYNIKCSICGQAPSTYEDLVEMLVKWGFTSISVNPDAINRVRGVIHEAEKKFVNGDR